MVGSCYFYDRDRANASRPYGEADLTEGLLRVAAGALTIEAGAKIVTWGEMIGPSVVDLANPRDL